MKASDCIVAFLEAQGVEYVFGYQGGMIAHLVDSLSKSRKVKFVQCYHEQSAAFAAEGYARATGKFGVCITTSGPGATNVVTGIGDAYFDSVPVLYLTGQVNSFEYKYDSPIRQKGFQETDIVSIVKPIVKYAALCDNAKTLHLELRKAVSAMMGGRKGPVLLDLPMDVQRADLGVEGFLSGIAEDIQGREAPEDCVKAAIAALAAAKRPLIICGGGLAERRVNLAARSFVKASRCPYAVSLMGKGLVDETDELCMGMIGSYGNRCANLALAEADVVLALGSRLDLRQTGNRKSPLLADKLFIRVDIDTAETGESPLPRQMAVNADAGSFCEEFAAFGGRFPVREEWAARVLALKSEYSQNEDARRHARNSLPYEVLESIARTSPADALFVADIGQNQMWAAQTIRCREKQGFYTSGGMAPMGYAIPAAVGAALANPRRRTICLCGDGGMHIAVQSLMLIGQHGLDVAVVVFNNRALGMITQFQRRYFDGNFAGTVAGGGYFVPDIEKLASAYSIPYRKVESPDGIDAEILKGPVMIEVPIDGLTEVVPKLEFDHDLDDMTPGWRSGVDAERYG